MNRTWAIISAACVGVVVVVCIILAVEYHGQESSLTSQLRQTERTEQQAEQAAREAQQAEHAEQTAQQAAKTSQSASTARLGICWLAVTDNTTGDMLALQMTSPVEQNGVYQCTNGGTFVSVVPQASK